MGLAGAEAVLKLRTLTASGDFDAYWRYHLRREDERIHHARYRDSLALAAYSAHLKEPHPTALEAADIHDLAGGEP